MDIDRIDIILAVEAKDRTPLRVVWDGELVVIGGEGRLFLYNRTTRKAFELVPDYQTGVQLRGL